jgi:formimidoylglutamate deiminase
VITLEGIASAHSHAFQRALRGRTQARIAGTGSFWSWRGLMYEVASTMAPDDLYDVSRLAFAELASLGVTAVGEFHYVHHQPGGAPYEERTLLSERVIAAALDAGLRITLLRVVYQRAGWGRPREAAQERFCDTDVEDALGDVESLLARWGSHPRVRIGLAPHSVRAVPRESLSACIDFARERNLPFHMHVGEQAREIRECLAEHGKRPLELLDELGALDPRFVAVHATHSLPSELARLGASRGFACICRSTERDLADGAPNLSQMVRSGVRLCLGADSHAQSDPFEEARAMELDERTRTGARPATLDAAGLMAASSTDGYASIGWAGAEKEDSVELDEGDLSWAGAPQSSADAFWSASGRAVRRVRVAGATIVEGGVPLGLSATLEGMRRVTARLG